MRGRPFGLVIAQVLAQLEKYTNKTHFVVAYSGGEDSTVLLHLMHRLSRKNPLFHLRAIHINHNLQPSSKKFEAHCLSQTAQLHIPLEIYVAQPVSVKSNMEAKAREIRYDFFQKAMKPNECLLLAHHADDQLETVLMRLCKGAGPMGLSGMSVHTHRLGIEILRPLLFFSKVEIANYANEHDLKTIHDPTNDSLQFERNFLRHKIIPLMREKWPILEKQVRDTAQHCQKEITLLDNCLLDVFESIYCPKTRTLNKHKLNRQSDLAQDFILRKWFQVLGLYMPNQKKLNHLKKEVLLAKQDANPKWRFGQVEVRRYRDKLYCLFPEHYRLLETNKKKLFGVALFRESISNKKKLKKYFQANSIPPWERDYLAFSLDSLDEGSSLKPCRRDIVLSPLE